MQERFSPGDCDVEDSVAVNQFIDQVNTFGSRNVDVSSPGGVAIDTLQVTLRIKPENKTGFVRINACLTSNQTFI
jgi:hypothetical protein